MSAETVLLTEALRKPMPPLLLLMALRIVPDALAPLRILLTLLAGVAVWQAAHKLM